MSKGINPFRDTPKDTLQAVALDWYERNVEPVSSKTHSERTISRLRRFAFPAIGNKPVKDITAPDLLGLIRPIEAAGHNETAHRTLQICGQVFRYAVAIGIGIRDPSSDLRGALTPANPSHFPAITDPARIGELMRAIDSLVIAPIVRCALRLSALTFVRPGELRTAEWDHMDLAKAEWRIPPEKMKMKRLHIVPLSRQAAEILEKMRPVSGHGRFVFPAVRCLVRCDRAMSDGTMSAVLRRLGYSQGEFTPHGFRSMASTILHEQGWPLDAIERQLAHVEGNSVRAAYSYAEHLDIRRKMMQAWADWLDGVKSEN